MSFFAELKQRKVVRVAVAYLVVAWIAIQVASIALPTFAAPIWVLRVLILLLAIGFPIALVLAWAVELSPAGVKFDATGVGSKRVLGFSVALLALAFAWYYRGQPALRHADVVVAAAAPERSIAVLPFVNMSGDPKNEYFSDGLAETTLDMLAQVPDLKVIARTSSFAFKGKAQDMRKIGAALGAAHLLEGSVQQAGDTLRITVQLIKAADGTHLWSQHYDRPMVDLFKIQDEIANHVVQELAIALPAQQQQHLVQKRTDNVAAYQEFLKGMALMPGRKVEDMREAARHFERAIVLDPAYARAYFAASDAYTLLGQYATISPEERRRSGDYSEKALALAPDLGEAHTSRGAWLENVQHDLVGAEREYRRGIELAPSYATGFQWYGEFLAAQLGRFEEALPYLQKAVALDPLSPIIRDIHTFFLGQSGRVDEALALSNQQIAAQPEIARYYLTRGNLQRQRGDLVAALRDMRTYDARDPDAVSYRAGRCHFLLELGALTEAKACVARLAQQAPASSSLLNAETRLALIAGDTADASAFVARMEPVNNHYRTSFLVRTGKIAEALAEYRDAAPGFFAQPTPQVYPDQAFNALWAGVALLETGGQAQGQAVLEAAVAALAHRPYAASTAGRGWIPVYVFARLGKKDRAFVEIQNAVDSGYFLGLPELDANPLLTDLRKDPRYQQILAPARVKAAAQVEAARKAGLL